MSFATTVLDRRHSRAAARRRAAAGGHFATRAAVELAASLFARESNPATGITVSPWTERERQEAYEIAGKLLPRFADTVQGEGPQWRIELSPGVLAVRRTDPVKVERAYERAQREREARVKLILEYAERGEDLPEPAPGRMIRSWSSKSRARMTMTLATFDYAAAGFGQDHWVGVAWKVGMVTLTYPGDWLAVAVSAKVCQDHLRKFRKRFERRWGPLVGVWKREFQRRGAPHFHLGCLVPLDPEFPAWLSATWAEVVGASTVPSACKQGKCKARVRCDSGVVRCSERSRHRLGGTGIDWNKGEASVDPRRFAIYFSKHGGYSAKEYQNEAPAEWAEDEGIGRFWGHWRLERATVGVEIAPDVARSVVRTARRWSDSHKARASVKVWRKVTWETLDLTTGELVTRWKWRKRSTTVPVRRLQRSAGFLVLNDAPRLAEALSRVATDVQKVPRPTGKSGAGPVGFLP